MVWKLAGIPYDQFDKVLKIAKSQTQSVVNFTPILKYFEKTWVNGMFNPHTWNQLGEFYERTKNNVYAYNKQVYRKLRV